MIWMVVAFRLSLCSPNTIVRYVLFMSYGALFCIQISLCSGCCVYSSICYVKDFISA